MKKIKVLYFFGTRPEAVKLAPLILESKKDIRFSTSVCLTAQHREMVDEVLRLFKIKPDFDLNIMKKGQSLSDLTRKIIPASEKILKMVRPDVVLVQGDTTTAFTIALQCFYQKIPIGHVEAGLRSGNKHHPFPEEVNRILISHIADFHFAPTVAARKNLLCEGIHDSQIFLTGNTVVDALQWIRNAGLLSRPSMNGKNSKRKKKILVTAHRRENFGKPLESICQALKDLVQKHPGTEVHYPVHLNPNVQKTVQSKLSDVKNIHLLPPVSYEKFLALMDQSYLILTDSGGIQEEAPSFGKPVLVMRKVSERSEGIDMGVAKLVGTSREAIFKAASRLIREPEAYARMVQRKNPYGDGRASKKILAILAKVLKAQK